MGLTKNSVGIKAVNSNALNMKTELNQYIIALAGNPNVGKSTVFNGLTGLNQHTGNWAGKTVTNAKGYCKSENNSYLLVDIPGTYSLMAHSAEEEVARNFICFSKPDGVVVVCDATCLERNLNLVLQIMEVSKKVIVCVNLMDEAERKGIQIDLEGLSNKLGVPIISMVARKKKSIQKLLFALDSVFLSERKDDFKIDYGEKLENSISIIADSLSKNTLTEKEKRWVSIKLLEGDTSIIKEIKKHTEIDENAVNSAKEILRISGIESKNISLLTSKTIIKRAEEISREVTTFKKSEYNQRDKKIDKILTSRIIGYPLMIILLLFIFWLTISASNYPSSLLSELFFNLEDKLSLFLDYIKAPLWLNSMLTQGIFRVLGWVVSVMLPPMAIFFPLFTILEDAGCLPRIAFNLDKPFKKCNACGKQALTMCMGFGCNAAGVVGARIIDSKRERLLAILTNNFVPCNGRFPMIISIITMFFIGFGTSFKNSVLSSVILTGVILLGIVTTFLVTYILSKTLLKGETSSYTLELPPYRKPQIASVLVHSMLDRTIFVLGRAVAVAAPAGLVIWLISNLSYGGESILKICADFLNPIGELLGMDGIILIAFILGFPANEIVIPIAIMGYMSTSTLSDTGSLVAMRQILLDNGWTWTTAVSTIIFSLMHWPCSTTLMTIKKETASFKWTFVAFLIPTLMGALVCFIFNLMV